MACNVEAIAEQINERLIDFGIFDQLEAQGTHDAGGTPHILIIDGEQAEPGVYVQPCQVRDILLGMPFGTQAPDIWVTLAMYRRVLATEQDNQGQWRLVGSEGG